MVTKDEVVQLFESNNLASRLEKRNSIYEWSDEKLRSLDVAIDSLSGIGSDIFAGQLAELQQTRDRITEDRSAELQEHLEVWGYIQVDPNQLVLDLLLPVKPERTQQGLEKLVFDHCSNVLERYAQPELQEHKGYVSIQAPLLTLQQVGEVVTELSRNPRELRNANTSFAIYEKHSPLSETYQIRTARQLAQNDTPSAESRQQQRKEKVLEYLGRHSEAPRMELIAYLTGADLGTEKEAGDSIYRMVKAGVIRTTKKGRYPVYSANGHAEEAPKQRKTKASRSTLWPVIDSVINVYHGEVPLNVFLDDVCREAGLSNRGLPVVTIKRYGAQHGIGIKEEAGQRIVYKTQTQ